MADNNYIVHENNHGTVNISLEVVAAIAASAALECQGVAALHASGKDISGIISGKNAAKSVKVTQDDEGIKVEVYLTVKLGVEVGKVGEDVQNAVEAAIESMTGCQVKYVSVHVTGLSLDK